MKFTWRCRLGNRCSGKNGCSSLLACRSSRARVPSRQRRGMTRWTRAQRWSGLSVGSDGRARAQLRLSAGRRRERRSGRPWRRRLPACRRRCRRRQWVPCAGIRKRSTATRPGRRKASATPASREMQRWRNAREICMTRQWTGRWHDADDEWFYVRVGLVL